MTVASKTTGVILAHLVFGAVLGILVIHPVAMAAAWFEVNRIAAESEQAIWSFLRGRIWLFLMPHQLPMSGLYAAIGGLIGIGFGLYGLVLRRETRTINYYEKELAQNIPALISAGESERVEFKASIRWDFHHARVNRALETVVAKTIAGFFNCRGGDLLIGVTDAGDVVGVENDYRTLKHQDRDGFQRCLTDIVRNKLGADLCPLVHVFFREIDQKDVCLVAIEPAPRPVYCADGKASRFFVRTGNNTREFDAREAINHAATRWPRK